MAPRNNTSMKEESQAEQKKMTGEYEVSGVVVVLLLTVQNASLLE